MEVGNGSSRQRFNIELRPGETTIVSWKRLIKEATKADPSASSPSVEQSSLTATAQQAQKVQVALDEYFQDEKSNTKFNDFTINKEKLEHLNEGINSTDCQLKKRKKYMPKALGENVDGHVPKKYAKLGHARSKFAAKNVPLVGNSSAHLLSLTAKNEHYQDRKLQNPLDCQKGFLEKKHADNSSISDNSLYSAISNKDASIHFANSKETEKQRIATAQCRSLGNNVKDESEFSCATRLKDEDKNSSKQLEPQANGISIDTSGLEFSTNVCQREKNGSNGLPDLNIPASPVEPVKTAFETASNSKDVSSVRTKGTTLERAIRELEKVVAESRPHNMEVQDADTPSITIKRRLPREVKQKLAKVARLAQSSQGKISEELVNRLMSILGHPMQLKTLKRNLREMVLLGLSAKREKADRFQQIKKEVIEMIKLQASKQIDGAADDFQEAFCSEEKGIIREKFNINNALEDKICDLYDLYVQGMDEDKGPQIRKLYIELAELWPNGTMDNHGIKKAIYRAKERRRASYHHQKVQENIRNKKLSMPRTEVVVRGEVSTIAQPKDLHDRLITETNIHIVASPNKTISSEAAFDYHLSAPVRTPGSMFKGSCMDLPKQEKLKRPKEEKQQHGESDRVNKLSLRPNKESHKSHKRVVSHPDVLNQLAAPPN